MHFYSWLNASIDKKKSSLYTVILQNNLLKNVQIGIQYIGSVISFDVNEKVHKFVYLLLRIDKSYAWHI